MTSTTIRATFALALLAGSEAPLCAQVALTPVAVTGQSGGRNAGAMQNFSRPVISDANQVAFNASLSGRGISGANSQALYIASGNGRLTLAARTGQTPPGLAKGVRLAELFDPMIAADGQVAFAASLAGPGVNDRNRDLVMAGQPGQLRVAVRTGDALAEGAVVSDLFHAVMNPRGQMAITVALEGANVDPTTSRAILLGTRNGMAVGARLGQSIPGLPGQIVTLGLPALNANGDMVFQSFLGGANVPEQHDNYVMRYRDGVLSPAVLEGAWAAGLPAGVGPITFSTPSIDGAGHVAFSSLLEGPGVTWSDDLAVIGVGGVVARMGQPITADLKMGIVGAPLLADGGRMTFTSSLLGEKVDADTDLALWNVDSAGELRMIAREGQAVSADFRVVNLQGTAMNARGQVVFAADVQPINGGPVSSALYAWDPARGVVEIAEPGQSITLGRRSTKAIASVDFVSGSGGQDGRASGLNNQGGVVFRARFTDGTAGVMIAALPGALSDIASSNGAPVSDGRVTSADLATFMRAYASANLVADVASDDPNAIGGDGRVDEADLIAFLADFQNQEP